MERQTEGNIKGDRKENKENFIILSDSGRWALTGIVELRERFGITSPGLVAKALRISETLAEELIKNLDSARNSVRE
jgi:hypothetical protein